MDSLNHLTTTIFIQIDIIFTLWIIYLTHHFEARKQWFSHLNDSSLIGITWSLTQQTYCPLLRNPLRLPSKIALLSIISLKK